MSNRPRRTFWSRIFRKKFKSHLVEGKYRIDQAFVFDGITYYQFSNQMEIPTGRQLMAIAYYEELRMKIDREYMDKFIRAFEKIISDPKKISIHHLSQMVVNLKERLDLMPLPDYIFRLASVVFFDETESLYSYDYAYNQIKIKKWKESGNVLDFFLTQPLKDLIPALNTIGEDLKIYFPVVEKIDQIHQEHLSGILSGKE